VGLILAIVYSLLSWPSPSLAAGTSTSCAHTDTEFHCVRFVRNYDADTVTFDIPGVHPLIGKNISVRVRHVDAPEMRGHLPCEKQAARTARKLVENLLQNAKRIDLVDVGKDKYFRILADVVVDGQLLKDVLIKNRMVYGYEGGTKSKLNWCERFPASSAGPAPLKPAAKPQLK
jgi:micrococcal nuclease